MKTKTDQTDQIDVGYFQYTRYPGKPPTELPDGSLQYHPEWEMSHCFGGTYEWADKIVAAGLNGVRFRVVLVPEES